MIVRPFTIISGLAFVLSGAMMFVVKHQSQMLDAQLSGVNQATQQDEQSIRVLQAQWALEADPSRLASLAAQFTGLQPMKPGQLVTMASLGNSLPPPGAKPPGSNPEDPVPVMPQLAAAQPAPAAVPAAATTPAQAVATVAARAPAPVPLTAPTSVQTAAAAPVAPPASAQAVPAPVVRTVAAVPALKPAAPAHVASVSEIAPVAPVPHHHVAPGRLARESVPVHHVVPPRHEGGSSVYLADVSAPVHAAPVGVSSAVAPMGAPVMSVRAVAAPAPAPIDDGGSMLGMAQGSSQ
ncbi:MAG TPA: hypothetical protein VEQ16_10820 [Acidocella sp.]|jgi:hypothetical protein|nr:hypothetical protein [Acidocella sp.]